MDAKVKHGQVLKTTGEFNCLEICYVNFRRKGKELELGRRLVSPITAAVMS